MQDCDWWVLEHEGRPWDKFQSLVWVHIGPKNIAVVIISLSSVAPWASISSWVQEWKAVNSIETSADNTTLF